MTTPEKTLLVVGIVFFAILVVVLFVLLARKENKGVLILLPFFFVPIAMIGFSEIKVVKVGGSELETKTFSDYKLNPNDPNNIAAFSQTVNQLSTNANTANSSQIRSNLVSTVSAIKMLRLHSEISPASRLALSHAEFVLGHTNDAVKTATSAVAANTNLLHMVNPQLRMFLKPALNH